MTTMQFAAARLLAAMALCALIAVPAFAEGTADTPQIQIQIRKDHFEPARLTLPAGKRIKLTVANTTALPAEFESNDFTAEKVIPGHTTLPVYIGPLDAGTYTFFNDFAQGVTGQITVK